MTDQSPAQKELAAFLAWKHGSAKGGRNRWKGTTKASRSAEMRRVALSKKHAKQT
jgi:hypothetical protein